MYRLGEAGLALDRTRYILGEAGLGLAELDV
jgi:hypothetical protein